MHFKFKIKALTFHYSLVKYFNGVILKEMTLNAGKFYNLLSCCKLRTLRARYFYTCQRDFSLISESLKYVV